jgi:hypothetical protein
MKPFDDMLSEEQEPQYAELLPMLQRLYDQPALPTDKQSEAVARVRERLLDAEINARDIPRDTFQVGTINPLPQSPIPPVTKPHRVRKVLHLVNTIAAILVVGAIISVSVLLFAHRSPLSPAASATPTATRPASIGPMSNPVTIHTRISDFDVSMSLPRGPYFLGELIEADLSFTNHTHLTALVGGRPCQSLYVTVEGGTAPHVIQPTPGFMHCSSKASQVKADQTLSSVQYLVLTSSGYISVKFGVTFVETVDSQFYEVADYTGAFLNQAPSIQITVQPQVPSDHVISFKLAGKQVTVHAPTYAQTHLLYMYSISCFTDGSDVLVDSNNGWQPLPANIVSLPACPGTKTQWQFAFGAVGYAFVSGHYPV